MPILIKDVTGEKDPIELTAPVITDATDAEQAQEILQFIDTLRWSRVTDVAAAEVERLAKNGYWAALSAYAMGAIDKMQDPHAGGVDPNSPPDIEAARKFLEERKIPYKQVGDVLEIDRFISVSYEAIRYLPDLRAIKTPGFGCVSCKLTHLSGAPQAETIDCKNNDLQDLSDLPAACRDVLSDFGDFEIDKIPQELRQRKSAADIKEKAKQDIQAQSFAQIFNGMAEVSRAAMISEVVIIPTNIDESRETQKLFAEREKYDQEYRTAKGVFRFGFFQVEDNEDKKQSTTFATFTIDSKLLKVINKHKPQKMLGHLQAVMTLVNHDMLHQLSLPGIREDIAKNRGLVHYRLPSSHWFSEVRDYTSKQHGTEAYEDLLQIMQEKTVLKSDPDNKIVMEHVKNYFDELMRIRDVAMRAAKGNAQKDFVRDSVNYCAMLMAHALTRAYPLDHPVMGYCVDRMVQADPQPERILEDCFLRFDGRNGRVVQDKVLSSYPSRESKIHYIQHHSKGIQDILEQHNFLKAGLHKDDPRLFKMMELVAVSRVDVVSHNPGAKAIKNKDQMIALRENADDLTIKMATAMRKTVDRMRKETIQNPPAELFK